jgi:DNA polymerase-3 subunit gamma/tau
MSYKVLSLKWRPQTFEDIVGQDHVTKTLINAFKLERVAQGYMFTGPRGVGKTTTARILSRALNADGGPRYDFDPSTNLSLEIAEGRALDVLEIDGASNRGIEEIRNLREQIKFAPMVGNYKVIIIDEVHMLTNPAFNALLRTLEEPPEHGKFIFCTTDIHKVPATIISRCQRFDFNRIATDIIISRLTFILDQESIDFDADSLQLIARKADGSMRDALSILDQVISFCGAKISSSKTTQALGVIPNDIFFEYTHSLLNKNGNQLLHSLDKFLSYGVPAEEVVSGLSNHMKNLLYSQIDGGSDLLDINDESKKQYISHSSKWDRRDLLRSVQILTDLSSKIRRSDDPYLLLEFSSLKLLEMDKSVSIESLLLSKDIEQNSVNTKEKASLPIDSKTNKLLNEKKLDTNLAKTTENQTQLEKSHIDNEIKDEEVVDIKTNLIRSKKAEENLNNQMDELENNVKKDNTKKTEDEDVESIVKELDLNFINEKWQDFIDSIHVKKPSVASILDKSKPISISSSDIIIEITSTLDFHVNQIEKNRDSLNTILSEIFGNGVGFKVQKGVEKENKSSGINIKGNTPDSENDEQVRDKVVDLFDGEIIT